MSAEAPQISEFRRGPGGRPSAAEAERRRLTLLESAARLFLERGFDAVSIDEISRRSGVAKRFIYARYKSKEELFIAAIDQISQEKLQALRETEKPPEGAEEGLTQFASRLLELALHPDAIALHRLFMSAAPRFPELTRAYIERNRSRNLGELRRLLEVYAERGEIVLDDPQLVAEHFFILTIGIPQRLALLGLREAPEEESRRLRSAVRLFLHGCRRQGPARDVDAP